MIVYRKAQPLRVRRLSAPEPPFWCASVVQPYATRRAVPLALDYGALRASAAEKLDVTVCADVHDELDRMRPLNGPVLVDASESAEEIFRRGEDVVTWCASRGLASMQLVSTRGVIPAKQHADAMLAIACWPPTPDRLERLFADASERGLAWGVVIPLLYPVTTELALLETLADLAARHGAHFLAAVSFDADATARQALARSLELDPEDDRYALMFHGAVDPILVSSERHLAALAAERGLADFVVPPRWSEKSNWNASVLLALTGSRMMAMELDLDLAGTIARSARLIAELDKPLTRIAASAALSIIGGLDETSAAMLTEWIEGEPPSFAAYVDEQWRLRRG